ncbi:hypothetical protein [Mesorhizobium sp.]|jgi:hypothetical protein|uniref:hypothetical protein n=1 Tax=Mesorhizobium sp. TaxID=1871066 RepID=UPI003565C6F1
MKRTALTLASLLLASGMAVAGSDHFNADFVPAAGSYPTSHAMLLGDAQAVDPSVTTSINGAMGAHAGMPADSGQGIWGR